MGLCHNYTVMAHIVMATVLCLPTEVRQITLDGATHGSVRWVYPSPGHRNESHTISACMARYMHKCVHEQDIKMAGQVAILQPKVVNAFLLLAASFYFRNKACLSPAKTRFGTGIDDLIKFGPH